jgi:Leucine-rich repeat (LRR) protein
MEPITESSYTINKNDFKYKKMRKMDINKIENKELVNMYYNTNFDTLEYRIEECLKEGGKILDLKHLELTKFPELPNNLINKLEELYISNNELEILPDLSNYKKLKILDVSVNKLKKINNLPSLLMEFCCFDNELKNIELTSSCKKIKNFIHFK